MQEEARSDSVSSLELYFVSGTVCIKHAVLDETLITLGSLSPDDNRLLVMHCVSIYSSMEDDVEYLADWYFREYLEITMTPVINWERIEIEELSQEQRIALPQAKDRFINDLGVRLGFDESVGEVDAFSFCKKLWFDILQDRGHAGFVN